MSQSCWRYNAADELKRIEAISSRVLDPSRGALDVKTIEENSIVIKTSYKCFLSLLTDLQNKGTIRCRRSLIIRFMATHCFLEFLQLTEEWELAFLSQLSHSKSYCTNECRDITRRYYNVYISSTTESAPCLYAALRQMAKLCKKLRINRADLEISLSSDLKKDDRSLDDRINFPEMEGFIQLMHERIVHWTADMDFKFLPFRHGTGAVANEAPKSGSLQWKDDYTVITRKVAIAARLTRTPLPRISSGGDDLPSKQVFVPKTAKTLRGICEETVSRQFFQQGVMRYWYRYIRRQPFLRQHFPIHDQTVNQQFACIGSLTGCLATLDLSKASDTVSWNLVKRLFKGTLLYPWMIATRATSCKYQDGEVLPLRKFAPMGSALCFPTECFVFGAVVDVVLYLYRQRNPINSICEDWSVYGDDIIVAVEVADSVVIALEHLGFLVNRDKSYTSGPFRESCGKDYLFGHDVTPFYLRDVSGLDSRLCPNSQDRLIQYANHCFDRGYSSLRKVFITCLATNERKFRSRENYSPFLFSKRGVPSCVWTDNPEQPKNACFNKYLWRLEARALVLKTQEETRPTVDSNPLALYRCLTELEWRGPSLVRLPKGLNQSEKDDVESDLYRKQRTCWGLRSVSISDLDF